MKRKDFVLFFVVPFVGILVIVLTFVAVNRSYIKGKTEDLVHEQVLGAAEILRVNVSHFLGEGMAPEEALGLYEDERTIYYMALLDDADRILAWVSRYEGYLPFSQKDSGRLEPWVIDSPAGKIFNLLAPFELADGRVFVLYLGYSLASLDEMLARADRNFAAVLVMLGAVGAVFFTGIFVLQRRYLAKVREAETEKKEKERFREISAFTSAVAHEIKNPLNSLVLMFELLQKKGPAELRDDVALGKAEVRRIGEGVDRFSKELKPIRTERERVGVREVVEAAWRSVGSECAGPGLEFRYEEGGEGGPVVIEADRGLLLQVLQNLIRNACEATVEGRVTVSARRARRKVVIRVEDTGKGLPEEARGRLFDPFVTTKDKGMGIGLYVSRKIVEAHGGRISAGSGEGRGTVFTITLPEEGHG